MQSGDIRSEGDWEWGAMNMLIFEMSYGDGTGKVNASEYTGADAFSFPISSDC